MRTVIMLTISFFGAIAIIALNNRVRRGRLSWKAKEILSLFEPFLSQPKWKHEFFLSIIELHGIYEGRKLVVSFEFGGSRTEKYLMVALRTNTSKPFPWWKPVWNYPEISKGIRLRGYDAVYHEPIEGNIRNFELGENDPKNILNWLMDACAKVESGQFKY